MGRANSKFLRNTVDFEAQLGEVQQQAHMHAGRIQIIYALHGMRRVKRPGGFQFDDDWFLDDRIGDVLPALVIDSFCCATESP